MEFLNKWLATHQERVTAFFDEIAAPSEVNIQTVTAEATPPTPATAIVQFENVLHVQSFLQYVSKF